MAPGQLVDTARADLHVRLYIERQVESYAELHIRLYTNSGVLSGSRSDAKKVGDRNTPEKPSPQQLVLGPVVN